VTRWKFLDTEVLREILSLPPTEREQILDDLAEVEIDPRNARNDPQSTIQPYKDDSFPGCYSIMVVQGKYWVVYQVKADHPKVWLRRLVRIDDMLDRVVSDDD
jgi:mRNA-degrading endonuclease RelE of RelBE toxin-antitoxin system